MNADFDENVKGRKTQALISVLRTLLRTPPREILVVGCGSGAEAGDLARAFAAATIGIDVGNEFTFDHAGAAPAQLRIMDAQKLEFADASFDLVYSFHALEHIPNPPAALAEMARVLRVGCPYLIGTPNKSRLLGYIGSPTSLANKIKWNVNDLRMRVLGKWSNEAGAHAGFTQSNLNRLCYQAFRGSPRSISDDYYMALYGSHKEAVRVLSSTGLKSFLYPCVYVAGLKAPTD